MAPIRVAIVGCGSVSEHYLKNLQAEVHGETVREGFVEHMRTTSYAEVVSVCDLVESRMQARRREFNIPHGYTSIEEQLAGAEFDLLVNLTSMPAHYEINKLALNAGRHVLCEKPFAPTHAQGRELVELARAKGVRFWAAPDCVMSPQFRCMAEALARGEIGRVQAAHGCYGHEGPSWGPWFYRRGGGAIFDLAVYNLTFLTGLLGPARSVTALAGTVTPHREIEGESVHVEVEDNAMILLDHGDAVFSHIQTGFCYGTHNYDRTIELIGTKGVMNLLQWDWAPAGVQIRGSDEQAFRTLCAEPSSYCWEAGAAYAAESLATGRELLMTVEHALHVVEVMEAAHESARTGRRIALESGFDWPLLGRPAP